MTTTADEVLAAPCHACHGRAAPAYTPPCLPSSQAEDSLPDLLAAMDAAAELQNDAEQPGSDAEQLDVAALRQSLVDLTRLGSSEQQGPGAKADAQRWKEVFGSDTAWSKCPRPQQQFTRPPTRSRSPPACSGLPSYPKRRAVTAWPLRRALLCVPDVSNLDADLALPLAPPQTTRRSPSWLRSSRAPSARRTGSCGATRFDLESIPRPARVRYIHV